MSNDQTYGVIVDVKANLDALRQIDEYLDKLNAKAKISVEFRSMAAGIAAQNGGNIHQAIMQTIQVKSGVSASDAGNLMSMGFDPRSGPASSTGRGFIYQDDLHNLMVQQKRIDMGMLNGQYSNFDYRYDKYLSSIPTHMEQGRADAPVMSPAEFRQAEFQYADLKSQKAAQDAAEKAAERAQRDIERAQERQQREAERALRRAYKINPSRAAASAFDDDDKYDDSLYDGVDPIGLAGLRARRNILRTFPGLGNSGIFMRGFAKGSLYAIGTSAAAELAAITDETMSGVSNPRARAEAGGQLIGGIVGSGIGALFGGFGGIIGSSVGGQVGQQLTGFLMAGDIYKYNTQRAMMGYGLSVGGSSTAAQIGASSATFSRSLAQQYDEAEMKRTGEIGGAIGTILDFSQFFNPFASQADLDRLHRRTGTYSGIDRVDPADVLKGEQAYRAGLLAKGIVPTDADVKNMLRKANMGPGGSAGGVTRLTALGQWLTAEASNGGNFVDTIRSVGAPTWTTAAGDDVPASEKERWIKLGADWKREEYNIGRDDSTISWAAARLATRTAQGVRIGQLGDAYNILRSSMGDKRRDLVSLYNSIPDKSSAFAKSTNVMIEEIDRDIANSFSTQSRQWIETHAAEAGVRAGYHTITQSRLGFYGMPGDFSKEANRYAADLAREIGDVEGDLRRPGLSDIEKRGLQRQRLNLINEQRSLIPTGIHEDYARWNMLQGANMSEAAFGSAHAERFGSIADVNNAAINAIQLLTDTIRENNRILSNPNASIADKVSARQGNANAYNMIEQERINARSTELNRATGEYGIRQTNIEFGSYKANMFGTGADILAASKQVGGELDAREQFLKDQLKRGDLTVEQSQNIRKELASIPQARMSNKYNSLTASFERDDIAGYGYNAMVRDEQKKRLQYMPFSPGSLFKLDLGQILENEQQLKVIDARQATLTSNGMYGPQQRYELERQRQSIYTQDAAAVADLTEGIVDRLPAMSAGRPSSFHSYSSIQLAQLQLRNVSHPSRYFGALNGAQAAMQDNFINSFGVQGASRGTSRMGEVDSIPYLERIARALDSIDRKTQVGSSMGASNKPGQTSGQDDARQRTTSTVMTLSPNRGN